MGYSPKKNNDVETTEVKKNNKFSKNKKVNDYINIKINKDKVVGENAEVVLIKLDGQAFWFNKNFIAASEYTNYISLSVSPSSTYSFRMYDISGEEINKKKYTEISQEDLIEYILDNNYGTTQE